MADASIPLPLAAPAAAGAPARHGLERHARRLAAAGLAWHAVEATVAILAGLAAGSIALIGFGADSVVEAVAGIVVLWRFAAARRTSAGAERRAQQLIALSFFAIAAYVGVEALLTLAGGRHPDPSWVGIGLAGVTVAVMPPLAAAKARVAAALNSSATASEGRQNLLCAYLSGALLLGLGGNALAGWWWLDPLAALAVTGVAIVEGRAAWRGRACGCCA